MEQTRLVSLIETLVNTGVGLVVSFVAWPPIAAMVGLDYTGGQHVAITAAFTAVSVARGYVIRRFFNGGMHRLAVRLARLVRHPSAGTFPDEVGAQPPKRNGD